MLPGIIQATDYEWYELDGRGHHLVKFVLLPGFQNKIPDDFNIFCTLPTWTPTHGKVHNWDLKKLDDCHVGLLVPRTWWNILFGWLPKKFKIKRFYLIY